MKLNYFKLILFALIITSFFGCKKKSADEPIPEPVTPPQKTIKITYEVTSSVAPFNSEAYNKLMFTGTEGGYLFETYAGTTWRKELTIADNGTSSIQLYSSMLLNGDKATATGKIYINNELKSTANSISPYYSNGHTQLILDVRYR